MNKKLRNVIKEEKQKKNTIKDIKISKERKWSYSGKLDDKTEKKAKKKIIVKM